MYSSGKYLTSPPNRVEAKGERERENFQNFKASSPSNSWTASFRSPPRKSYKYLLFLVTHSTLNRVWIKTWAAIGASSPPRWRALFSTIASWFSIHLLGSTLSPRVISSLLLFFFNRIFFILIYQTWNIVHKYNFFIINTCHKIRI